MPSQCGLLQEIMPAIAKFVRVSSSGDKETHRPRVVIPYSVTHSGPAVSILGVHIAATGDERFGLGQCFGVGFGQWSYWFPALSLLLTRAGAQHPHKNNSQREAK